MVGLEFDECVDGREQPGQRFPREPGDQVEVQVDVSRLAESPDILQHVLQVDAAIDRFQGLLRGRLDTDFKLEHPLRDVSQEFEGRLVEQVRADLEVEVTLAIVLQDIGKDLAGTAGVVVEGAVDQLDFRDVALHEQFEVTADAVHAEGADVRVEGAHAEAAAIGTASTGFKIGEAPREIDQFCGKGGRDVIQIREG